MEDALHVPGELSISAWPIFGLNEPSTGTEARPWISTQEHFTIWVQQFDAPTDNMTEPIGDKRKIRARYIRRGQNRLPVCEAEGQWAEIEFRAWKKRSSDCEGTCNAAHGRTCKSPTELIVCIAHVAVGERVSHFRSA